MEDFKHTPVLVNEILSYVNHFPQDSKILDATFGRGGHTKFFLDHFKNSQITCIDQDKEAIEFGNKILESKVKFIHSNFENIKNLNLGLFQIILADLGVSSPQFDNASRGFSFNKAGHLDMRMDSTTSLKASDIVNTFTEKDLIKIFTHYGEIKNPFRVIKEILILRKTKFFETTIELAQLIAKVDGWRTKGYHPATQYFMALRLIVNQELVVLEEHLQDLVESLAPKGRLLVISFHSLEDRIVKTIFKNNKLGQQINKKIIEASDEEIKMNPRSRSAKLRVFERNEE